MWIKIESSVIVPFLSSAPKSCWCSSSYHSLFSIITANFIGLYLYFTRNFTFWQKLGIPYVNPTPFVGNLKDSVFQKVNIGTHLQKIYEENSDKPYVEIFSFDKPILLIRDVELAKNILVKDSQSFIDHVMSVNEEIYPLLRRGLIMLKKSTLAPNQNKLNSGVYCG